jgi:molybdopterin converting factor small subunit
MRSQVKLIGVLGKLIGRKVVNLQFKSHAVIEDVIEKIISLIPDKEKQMLIDFELNDSRQNMLILLNGVEVSALDGLKTRIHEGDKVVMIPISHGG